MKNAYFAATIALLWGSGCSLINSLDSVKPEIDNDAGDGGHTGKGGKGTGGRAEAGGTTGTGGTSGKGGTTGSTGGTDGGGGMDASVGGMPTMDSGAGGATSGGGGMDSGAAGTDGGDNFVSGGPNGAVVAYDPDGTKLWVLDPTDGHLVSAALSARVLAVANDPATDYWYIFRQPGSVTANAELQVRQLNTTTGEWKDIGVPVNVPNPATPVIGVLNQRLAYLSTPNPSMPNNATSGFSVIDTSKPEAAQPILRSRSISATGGKLALTARASTTGVGGTVTIAVQQSAPCTDAQGCAVSVIGETINATTIKEDTAVSMVGYVNPTGGNMGFASAEGTNAFDVIVIPPSTLPAAAPAMCTPNSGVTGTAALLDGSHAMVGSGVAFDIDNVRVSGATFDPCHNIAFATSLLGDTAVWAIPMAAGGVPQKLCQNTVTNKALAGGGTMLYEPYTKGIIRVTPDDNRYETYDFDATDPTKPVLKSRALKFPALFVNKGAVLAVRRLKDVCK